MVHKSRSVRMRPCLSDEYRRIFDLSHDGLWIIDGDGTIVNFNQAAEKLNGVAAGYAIGKSVDELVAEGVLDASVCNKVLEAREPVSMVQIARRTGKELLVTATPSYDDAGEISYIVVNDRDVTELSILGRQLEEARQINVKFAEELAAITGLDAFADDIVAESPGMRSIFRVAVKLARRGVSNVLVLGESGTGKGLMARFLHNAGERRSRPFVPVNCAALPETLLEAELFGYEKGAFTGARTEGKAGLIELAEGGTLFLDEIGDMPFSIQAKLLKYLDDHEIRRLGSTRSKTIECTIIAATNHDLTQLVQEKKFRHDLYYRLNTFTLTLLPLRERKEDILPLANHFVAKYNALYRTDKRLSAPAARRLSGYRFDGNVRELESMINNAMVMGEGPVLDEYIASEVELESGGSTPVDSAAEFRDLAAAVADCEQRILREASRHARSTREIAVRLGTSQATVVRKMKRYGLEPPGGGGQK